MAILYQMLINKNYYVFCFIIISIGIAGYVFVSVVSNRYLGLKFKSNRIESKVLYLVVGLCLLNFIPENQLFFNVEKYYVSYSASIVIIAIMGIFILECMREFCKKKCSLLKSVLIVIKNIVRPWLNSDKELIYLSTVS